MFFYSLGVHEASNLDECQQLVEEYFNLSEKPNIVDISPESREFFFHRIDETLVGVLVIEYSMKKEGVSESLVARFRKDCDENNATERLIVTDNKIENSVKKLADSMDIRIESPDQILREMTESLLETALDERKIEVLSEKE